MLLWYCWGCIFFFYTFLFLLMSQWDERRTSIAASDSAIAPSGSCTNIQLMLLQQRFSQIFGTIFFLSFSAKSFIPKRVAARRALHPAGTIQYSDLADLALKTKSDYLDTFTMCVVFRHTPKPLAVALKQKLLIPYSACRRLHVKLYWRLWASEKNPCMSLIRPYNDMDQKGIRVWWIDSCRCSASA